MGQWYTQLIHGARFDHLLPGTSGRSESMIRLLQQGVGEERQRRQSLYLISPTAFGMCKAKEPLLQPNTRQNILNLEWEAKHRAAFASYLRMMITLT